MKKICQNGRVAIFLNLPRFSQARRSPPSWKHSEKEGEYIEHRGFATAVRPQQHGHGGKIPQGDIPQDAKILDRQTFDAGRHGASGVLHDPFSINM
ncbi:MAG: hypothetical protein HQM03_09880 [Magnetococcales bacterium]|nr:hypothetical protein [Magnetococcales bacterium]